MSVGKVLKENWKNKIKDELCKTLEMEIIQPCYISTKSYYFLLACEI